jgi:hypothetical protein
MLPNEAWARRISGTLSNSLANQAPHQAHAILTLQPNRQHYTVSVRAPKSNPNGADAICVLFVTGGGRKAAAGINALPIDQLNDFVDRLSNHWPFE